MTNAGFLPANSPRYSARWNRRCPRPGPRTLRHRARGHRYSRRLCGFIEGILPFLFSACLRRRRFLSCKVLSEDSLPDLRPAPRPRSRGDRAANLFVMLLLLLLAWPVSAAGFQYVADDVLRGRQRRSESIFRGVAMLGRMLTGLLVYGSYCVWFFLPLAAMIALIGGIRSWRDDSAHRRVHGLYERAPVH